MFNMIQFPTELENVEELQEGKSSDFAMSLVANPSKSFALLVWILKSKPSFHSFATNCEVLFIKDLTSSRMSVLANPECLQRFCLSEPR